MRKHASVQHLLLCLAVVLVLAVASTAGAQPGEWVKGKLQPLADGFPKRAITIINIDTAGTRDGIYARSWQKALKGMSPVPIMVSDEPVAQGGTWMKVNEMKTRSGAYEGYYPMIFDCFGVATDLLIEPRTREINAQLTDKKMILTTEAFSYVIIQKKKAPWGKTFKEMIAYAQAHPGELKYVVEGVGSGHDIAMELIMAKFGFKLKKVPQGSHQECASAVGAGQADLGIINADVALTNWQAKRVDVVVVLAEAVPKPWNKDPNCVSGKELGLPPIVGTQLALGVPYQVPQAHIDWLYKLFYAGSQTKTMKQRTDGRLPGVVSMPMTGPETDKFMEDILTATEAPIRGVGLHIDQQK